jgi:hypothetical protein
LPQHTQKGLLNQILREETISTDQAIEIAKQWGVVACHQRGECYLIACHHCYHDLFVAALVHRVRWLTPSVSCCGLLRARATKGSQADGSDHMERKRADVSDQMGNRAKWRESLLINFLLWPKRILFDLLPVVGWFSADVSLWASSIPLKRLPPAYRSRAMSSAWTVPDTTTTTVNGLSGQ